MSYYYADITNGRNRPRTVCGHKTRGLVAHIRSWDAGVRVTLWYDESTDREMVQIERTGGSTHPGDSATLFTGPIDDLTPAALFTGPLDDLAPATLGQTP